MQRIRKIRLQNFRSVLGEVWIDFGASGKNVFVYGENGSGKSTLCRALALFVEAADRRRKTDIGVFQNLHATHAEAEIEVVFEKNTDPAILKPPGLVCDEDTRALLLTANRYKGALDYRNLLRTYLIDTQRLNLFKLFVEQVFARTRNPETKRFFGIEWEEMGQKRQKLPLKRNDYGTRRKFDEELRQFSKGLKSVLDQTEAHVNRLIKRFDPLMRVVFQTKPVKLTEKNVYSGNSIGLEVYYGDTLIEQHHEFFNEARLSALAISIYLASFLYHTNEEEYQNAFKLLLLDDVFIGMDMGNRLPLLEILQEDFRDYQIVMTTYDKPWFEVAKHHLGKSDWRYYEFYIDAETDAARPRTKVLEPDKDSYRDKAWHYFCAKDYAACANYQRKAFEELVKALLPDSLQYAFDEDGGLNRDLKLATYFDRLMNFLRGLGLNTAPFDAYTLYSKIVLNPLSHDHAGLQIYRSEVKAVFGILDAFDGIEKRVVMKKGQPLLLSFQDDAGAWHNYKLQLITDLIQLRQDAAAAWLSCGCQVIRYRYEKEEWQEIEDGIEDTLGAVFAQWQQRHGVSLEGDYLDWFTNKDKVKLREMG